MRKFLLSHFKPKSGIRYFKVVCGVIMKSRFLSANCFARSSDNGTGLDVKLSLTLTAHHIIHHDLMIHLYSYGFQPKQKNNHGTIRKKKI